MKRMSHAGVVVALGLAGCASKAPVPYTTVFTKDKPYVPGNGSDNAFDAYILAAQRTAELVPAAERRRSYTAGFKAKTVSTLVDELEGVARGTKRPCQFAYRARGPFEVDTTRQDWALLGRAISWKAEAMFEAADPVSAVQWLLVGVRFGCDLTQGDVEDASVGFAVVGMARRVAREHLEAMSPDILVQLSDGIAEALGRCGSAETVVGNQEKAMLAAVQTVQDAYKQRETKKLEELLYKDSRDAVAYLRELKDADRPAYFAGFADEARSTAAFALSQAEKPARDRQPQKFTDDKGRPWRRFSLHFFSPAVAFLDLRDQFLAQTRLWAVDSRCRAAALTGSAPEGIAHLGSLATDPYSGKPFVYYAAGSDYKVYSVGRDGRDDGGHSDDGLQPDLRPDAGP